MATFFMVVASVSAQRLVEERQAQQAARRHRTRSGVSVVLWLPVGGVSGGQARKIVNATACSEVTGSSFQILAVPGALDRDGYCPDWELTGAGLLTACAHWSGT